jgi:alpha-L-fucosidase
MKSLPDCLHALIRCAGGDGNLLFNVGPMPTGEIEPRQIGRLQEMGAWLARNGESIYGTRGGPWKSTQTLASTRRGNTVYLHVLQWPGASVTLPNLPVKVRSASVLAGGKATVTQTGDKLVISVPERYHQPVDTVVKLKLNGSAMEIAPITITPNREESK